MDAGRPGEQEADDPETLGQIGGETAASVGPGLDMAAVDRVNDPAVDRSHNRDVLSAEAMTEMLRDLQDSLTSAETRVTGLEATHGQVSADSRELALGVARLGDSLLRRVRALENGGGSPPLAVPAPIEPAPILARPAPRKREPVLRLTLSLAVALALVLGAFWLLAGETAPRVPRPRPAPALQLGPIVITAPTTTPATVNTAPATPSPVHHWSGAARSNAYRSAPKNVEQTSPPSSGFNTFAPAAATTPGR